MSRLARARQWLPDGFVLAMVVAIALALVAPGIGEADGPLQLGLVAKVGIGLVFFLHGANLSFAALAQGLGQWKLHLSVQAATFMLFPLLGVVILLVASNSGLPVSLLLGFFYLCALPSTVSSSVALTAIARGNVPAAVFNSTISGLIGLFATPLLLSFATSELSGEMPSVGSAITGIAQALLLPFMLGQLARLVIGDLIAKYRKWTSKLDRAVIVLIVYSAFCDSTAAGTWTQFSWGLIVLTAIVVSVLLLIALLSTSRLARFLGFNRENEVTLVFCGSKKSLANAAPMAQVLFAGSPEIGVIMLPILFYHQIQLIVGAIMAKRYAAAGDSDPRTATIEKA